MDRDEFIIPVYCVVCEHYQMIKNSSPLRWGGFAPALSDEEVLIMELCGEYFKLATDKDLVAYFRTHYAHFFLSLRDRTLFVRQVQEAREPFSLGLATRLHRHLVVGPTQDGTDGDDEHVYQFVFLVPVNPRIGQLPKMLHQGSGS